MIHHPFERNKQLGESNDDSPLRIISKMRSRVSWADTASKRIIVIRMRKYLKVKMATKTMIIGVKMTQIKC